MVGASSPSPARAPRSARPRTRSVTCSCGTGGVGPDGGRYWGPRPRCTSCPARVPNSAWLWAATRTRPTGTGAAGPRRCGWTPRPNSIPSPALAPPSASPSAGSSGSTPTPGTGPGGPGLERPSQAALNCTFIIPVQALASASRSVRGGGSTFSWNGRSWSKAAPLPKDEYSNPLSPASGASPPLSCPSDRLCRVVDQYGSASTWNGAAWSAPVLHGTGTQSVSCPTTRFCAAAQYGQRADRPPQVASWRTSRASGSGVPALSRSVQ